MTRLTTHEININGRELARQLRGISVADARQILARTDQIIEEESVILATESNQVELNAGADVLPDGLDPLSQGLVGEREAEVVQASEGGVALSTDDNDQSGVAPVDTQILGAELGVSTLGAFDHSNLHDQAGAGFGSRQALIGGDCE